MRWIYRFLSRIFKDADVIRMYWAGYREGISKMRKIKNSEHAAMRYELQTLLDMKQRRLVAQEQRLNELEKELYEIKHLLVEGALIAERVGLEKYEELQRAAEKHKEVTAFTDSLIALSRRVNYAANGAERKIYRFRAS